MKKYLSLLLTALLVFGSLPLTALAEEGQTPDITGDYVEGQAIVCVEGGLQSLNGGRSRSASDIQIVDSLMTISDSAAENGLLKSRSAAEGDTRQLVLVESAAGEDTQTLIESLKDNPSVLFAEPNYRVQVSTDEATADEISQAAAEPSAMVSAEPTPSAGTQDAEAEAEKPDSDEAKAQPEASPLQTEASQDAGVPATAINQDPVVQDMSNGLWSMDNRGQMGGTAGVDINTKPVWNAGNKGSKNVAVAVLDTGVDYTNDDLATQMWDKAETGVDLAGIDGGGTYGKNVCSIDLTATDPTDPMDNMLHGTHCAGTIGASWDKRGVDGVCEDLQLIAVKGMNGSGGGILSDLIQGYSYLSAVCDTLEAEGSATRLKAINNSWSMPSYSEALNTAITTLGQKGVVSVFAAGNSSTNLDLETNTTNGQLPKAYTLVVGAMNSDATKAVFSSYGKQTVDVFAPGSSILSTLPNEKTAYMAPFADPSANYIYDGYEGDKPGATDKEAQNGGLPFYYYSDTAANHTGDAVADGEAGKAMLGNGCLKTTEVSPSTTTTLISNPITINAADSAPTAFFSFGAQNVQSSFSRIEVIYVGEDGTTVSCPVVDKVTQVDGTTGAMRRYNLWEYSTVQLPDNFASQPFQLKLEIKVSDASAATGLYIDAVGIGTQKVAYGYEHGTSMATPAVTGSVALLAAKYSNESADVLATRIKGGTTDSANYTANSISGGYLNVEKAQNNPNPVVYEAGDQDGTVTLKGHFLGNEKGSITIDGADATAAVVNWSADVITLDKAKLSAEKGRHEVVIKAGQNTGRSNLSFGSDAAAQGFETLNLPQGESLTTLADQKGDVGTMAATGGALYYFNGSFLTAYTTTGISDTRNTQTKVWRYVPDSSGGVWEQLPSPDTVFMYDPTACAWQGNVYLMGADVNTQKTMLLRFNVDENSWTTACELPDGLPNQGTLINYKDQLIYAGGTLTDPENAGKTLAQDSCYQINPDEKTAELASFKLPEALASPRLAVGGTDREIITLYNNAGTCYSTSDDGKTWQKATADYDNGGQSLLTALGGTSTGAIATGLVKNYNDSEGFADTWTLKAGDQALTASCSVYYPAKTIAPVGIAYQNYFYVLSHVSKDMEASGLVFKRMAVSTNDAAETTPGGGGSSEDNQQNGSAGQTKAEKASVNTGIVADSTLSTVICMGLLALCLAGSVLAGRRKEG